MRSSLRISLRPNEVGLHREVPVPQIVDSPLSRLVSLIRTLHFPVGAWCAECDPPDDPGVGSWVNNPRCVHSYRFCSVCRHSPWPCATAVAAGTARDWDLPPG